MVESEKGSKVKAPDVSEVNQFLVNKMLNEMGLPKADDIDEGRNLIALAFADEP